MSSHTISQRRPYKSSDNRPNSATYVQCLLSLSHSVNRLTPNAFASLAEPFSNDTELRNAIAEGNYVDSVYGKIEDWDVSLFAAIAVGLVGLSHMLLLSLWPSGVPDNIISRVRMTLVLVS